MAAIAGANQKQNQRVAANNLPVLSIIRRISLRSSDVPASGQDSGGGGGRAVAHHMTNLVTTPLPEPVKTRAGLASCLYPQSSRNNVPSGIATGTFVPSGSVRDWKIMRT